MKRKILFVHDSRLLRTNSSNSYYSGHLSNQIVERYLYLGTNVTFLMREAILGEENVKRYSKIDHSHFDFISIPEFKSIKNFIKKPEVRRIIKKAVSEHDVIIVRLPSAAGVIAFNYARRINKPILVEMVACVFDALWNYDWRGKLLAHYKYYNYKRLLRKASHTIYVTNEFLQSRYPTNGKAISSSDVEVLASNENILKNRIIRYKEGGNPLILGTIAAIDVPYKGQGDVILALSKLKDEGLFFHYKLVGHGNPARLNKIIEEYEVKDLVEIIGALTHNEVLDFLETIDIYIQPSKVEGLPRALVEAMSKACPSLGSTVGGIPQLLNEECTFKPGDVKQIIQRLKQVNTKWLIKNSEYNFNISRDYRKEILDEKRKTFYREFLEDWELCL